MLKTMSTVRLSPGASSEPVVNRTAVASLAAVGHPGSPKKPNSGIVPPAGWHHTVEPVPGRFEASSGSRLIVAGSALV